MKGDLIVLVPDRNTEAAVAGILERHPSLHTRPVAARIIVHPEKDPGCRLHGHELLRLYQNDFRFALLIFDREGCGAEESTRTELERLAEETIASSGWKGRCGVVITDPELEIWVWSDSPRVDQAVGWLGRRPGLREWMQRQGFELTSAGKPLRPKEALEAALRVARKPRSSALYRELALKVGFERCLDPAFIKLKELLRAWFPTPA